MTSRLVLKKLTASDLTLFEWQFKNRNAGNQKAINLNADVFVERLYPAIEDASRGSDGRLPLDLWVTGPGRAPPINLQRKIIKGGAYKNWRLDGEFIVNPIDEPNRFNVLAPGDFAVISFEGDVVPISATAILVAQGAAEDRALHVVLETLGLHGRNTMMVIDERTVDDVIGRAGLPGDHPLISLTLTEEIQDAALGGAAATERLIRSARVPRLSASALRRALDAAEEKGRLGEQWVALYLQRQTNAATINGFEWISQVNAIAPLDFRIVPKGAPPERVDVKTTGGAFERDLHVSMGELREMAADGGPYRIYRVYDASDTGAKLRVSDDLKLFARTVLDALKALPKSVTVDAISVQPRSLKFGAEIKLIPAEEEEGEERP